MRALLYAVFLVAGVYALAAVAQYVVALITGSWTNAFPIALYLPYVVVAGRLFLWFKRKRFVPATFSGPCYFVAVAAAAIVALALAGYLVLAIASGGLAISGVPLGMLALLMVPVVGLAVAIVETRDWLAFARERSVSRGQSEA